MSGSVSLRPINPIAKANREATVSKSRARHLFKTYKKSVKKVLKGSDRKHAIGNLKRLHKGKMSSIWAKQHGG